MKKIKRIHKIIWDIPKNEIVVFLQFGKIHVYKLTPSMLRRVKKLKKIDRVQYVEYSNRYIMQ